MKRDNNQVPSPISRCFPQVVLPVFVCTVVFVSLLCWSKESHAFDYDDNIGFMKEVPIPLKEAYPTCDTFLNIHWSPANPNPYAGKKRVDPPPPDGVPRMSTGKIMPSWVGKALIDMYIGGQKQRRGLIVLIINTTGVSGGVKHYRYLLPLDEYKNVVKDDPSQVLVQGSKEDDAPKQELGVMDLDSGNEVRWISERFLSWSDFFVPPGDHFPQYTLAHLSRNICYTSPEGDTVWRIEPAQPFVTDAVMTGSKKKQLQELLRLYERDCPALAAQAKHPPDSTERWHKDGGSMDSAIRLGYSRDTDGDGLLDYVFDNRDGLEFI